MSRGQRKHDLSVIVICFNEVDRIEACLRSVSGWADQLIIFDSGSTDGTIDIAKKYATDFHVTDWPGFGPQRQRALAEAKCEYVLSIDADEQVTPELRDEIDAVLSEDEVECAVYRMPWLPVFLGKRLKHGRYASPQARLFRRQGAQYPSKQIHETLLFPPGKVGYLKSGLLHDSFRNYLHCVNKHNDYAWLLAKEKQAKGRTSGLLFATFRRWWEFLYQYFGRLLVLDGVHGYLQARVLAEYSFNKYAALWSLQVTNTPVDEKFSPKHRLRQPEQEMDDAPDTSRNE